VHTNFYSVFDGVELLVLDESGQRVAQQPYIYHQSPHSFHGRDLTLKPGETRRKLVFPIALPDGVRTARVLLIGVLPGCDRAGLLASGSVSVFVPQRAGGRPGK
jgi:hypothetical protein